MKLYSYWRSSCSWRVRIALAYKGLNYDYCSVHLTENGGEQHSEIHRQRNPMAQVPVLENADGLQLSQSMAILEYLEEKYPQLPLLPLEAWDRAQARQLAEMVNAGIQPLQNLAVLKQLAKDASINTRDWARTQISTGLDALEAVVERKGGDFLVGDAPSFAELCLVPQLYNARRFECDLARWPRLLRAENAANGIHAFQITHPDYQPDAAQAA